MARTAIDALFDKADMRCTRCGAPAGTCNCWVTCACGWTMGRSEKTCGNPVHLLVLEIVDNVDQQMKNVYPDQMKSASGGFRRTLRTVLERVALKSLNVKG